MNRSTPLVTIAIALCNNEKYVERCLMSVVHQTYRNLEILIVDDGSTDCSVEKCDLFLKDKRCLLIKKENGGLSSSRQLALEHATGDYICFIDADDALEFNYVEKMLSAIKGANADICLCSTRMLREDGQIIKDSAFHYPESLTPYKLTNELLSKVDLHLDVYYTLTDSWNKMYRTSFLRETNVKFAIPKGLNGTDMLFNYQLAMFEPSYVTVSDYLYNHYMYQKSAVHRKKKDLFTSYTIILSSLIELAKKRGCETVMSNKLHDIYLVYLRDAFDDIFQESIGKEKRDSISALFNRHKEYIKEYSFLKSHRKMHSSKSLTLFDYSLLSSISVYAYIAMRNRAKKLS